jgi:hypothetical protein
VAARREIPRSSEPAWISNIPGWPERGGFSRSDKESVAHEWRSAVTIATDLVQGLHLIDESLAPRDRGRIVAMAYEELYLVSAFLRSVTRTSSAPSFRVAHAALIAKGRELPPDTTSARRVLKKIIARVRREQAAAPAEEPCKAGPTCRRYPNIALGMHGYVHRWATVGDHNRGGY